MIFGGLKPIYGSYLKFFCGIETIKVLNNGIFVDAEITVYKNYFPILWIIPLFPLGKSYKLKIPELNIVYVDYIPEEYREICKNIGKKF